MTIKIGEKIKALRLQNNITQEKLAEYLGVTPQAVSRWEKGTGYPDITVLPALASYFRISVDTLLGVDLTEGEQTEIMMRMVNLMRDGKIDAVIALGRKSIVLYPANHGIAMLLVSGINAVTSPRDSIITPENTELLELSVTLCHRCMKDAEFDIMRTSARLMLVYALQKLNKIRNGDSRCNEAIEVAYGLPILATSQEYSLLLLFNGEEREKYLTPVMSTQLPMFIGMIKYFNCLDSESNNAMYYYTPEDCEDFIKVWNIAYRHKSESLKQVHVQYMYLHLRSALLNAIAGNIESAKAHYNEVILCCKTMESAVIAPDSTGAIKHMLMTIDPSYHHFDGEDVSDITAIVINGYINGSALECMI